MSRVLSVIALIVCLTAIAVRVQTANADLIVQHQGSTDPTLESWTKGEYGLGGTVAGVNDGGTAAWQIANPAGPDLTYYDFDLTSAQLSAAQTNGYSYTAKVRVVNNSTPVDWTNDVWVDDGRRDYYLKFGSDSSGNQIVEWLNGGQSTLSGGSIYHTYEIRVAANASSASVYADGNLLASGWTGIGTGEYHNLFFGAAGSTYASTANFASVSFTTVPEPASMVLLVTGLLGLMAYAWRKRK